MAILGKFNDIKKQFQDSHFMIAFSYLEEALDKENAVYKRILSYAEGSFEKIMLDDGNFALEQVYMSKKREDCFFESHDQYIDVQLIVKNEEIIDLADKEDLEIDMSYNHEMDLIKYHNSQEKSSLLLKESYVAIFFPEDAHMPCLKSNDSVMVYKTVVKVPVS